MRKIKICYLVSSLCNEGPVNVIYNIVKYIDYTKFDVSIVTFIPEKENSRIDDFRVFPLKIYQLSVERTFGIYKLYSLLKKQVNEICPDELHAHCPRSLYLMPFLPKKYKKIYTIHIYPGEQQLKLYGNIKGRIVIFLNHFFTKCIDLPIACAESVAEQYKIEKGWKIMAIPNGSSFPLWQKDEITRQNLRKEFGLKDGVKYFIFIGRFSKEKNPDILFNAFEGIKRDDVGLVMLGMGPMWTSLKKICPNNIVMPGFSTRVYDYLIAADYYISASDVEGLANTILESMSIGMPMLLSDIPSHREVLANLSGDDKVGYIIDNHNPEDIRGKIDLLLTLDSTHISNIMRDLYLRKYTAKVMSLSYQEAYTQLMNR